jgi:hypothetical protein
VLLTGFPVVHCSSECSTYCKELDGQYRESNKWMSCRLHGEDKSTNWLCVIKVGDDLGEFGQVCKPQCSGDEWQSKETLVIS